MASNLLILPPAPCLIPIFFHVKSLDYGFIRMLPCITKTRRSRGEHIYFSYFINDYKDLR